MPRFEAGLGSGGNRMHGRIVKAKRHPDRAAEIKAGRPGPSPWRCAGSEGATRAPADAARTGSGWTCADRGRDQEAEQGRASAGARAGKGLSLWCARPSD